MSDRCRSNPSDEEADDVPSSDMLRQAWRMCTTVGKLLESEPIGELLRVAARHNPDAHHVAAIRSTGTHAVFLLSLHRNTLYISSRSTTTATDALHDLDRRHVRKRNILVLRGFARKWISVERDVTAAIRAIVDTMQPQNVNIVWCGHSLGGAMATLFWADRDNQDEMLITFGAPNPLVDPHRAKADAKRRRNFAIYCIDDPLLDYGVPKAYTLATISRNEGVGGDGEGDDQDQDQACVKHLLVPIRRTRPALMPALRVLYMALDRTHSHGHREEAYEALFRKRAQRGESV